MPATFMTQCHKSRSCGTTITPCNGLIQMDTAPQVRDRVLTGPFVVGVWCAVDDVRTLANTHSSAADRINAGFALAGFIPAVRLEEIGVSIVERFGGAGRMALSNYASGGIKRDRFSYQQPGQANRGASEQD